MVGHGGSSAGSYLADPTSPIPSHCASIVTTSTVWVNMVIISPGNENAPDFKLKVYEHWTVSFVIIDGHFNLPEGVSVGMYGDVQACTKRYVKVGKATMTHLMTPLLPWYVPHNHCNAVCERVPCIPELLVAYHCGLGAVTTEHHIYLTAKLSTVGVGGKTETHITDIAYKLPTSMCFYWELV